MGSVFRDLTENDIDVRIGEIGINDDNNGGWATLLLYKNARVDMNILDETVGVTNWQRKHYECKGNLYCSVGINVNYMKDLEPRWVWKDDCGTEGNFEKEKSEASDSFKRACVNWGIGRELYTAPNMIVNIPVKKDSKGRIKPIGTFKVEKIKIENKVITGLSILHINKGESKRVFLLKPTEG